MSSESLGVSTCRCCQFYAPVGRRGGTCQTLGVNVQGCWKGCRLSQPAFTMTTRFLSSPAPKVADLIVT